MLRRLTLFPVLAIAFVALMIGGVFSVEDAEAVPFGYGGTTLVDAPTYVTGAVLWSYRVVSNHTTGVEFTMTMSGAMTGTGVSAPFFVATVPGGTPPQAGCTLGAATTNCAILFGPGNSNFAFVIATQSITQTCAARDFVMPALTITGWPGTLGAGEPPIAALPSQTFPGLIPANPALCPVPTTPVANTPVPPTATPTLVPPAVVPVIPQVFQHVPQGIFNGSRNNTPTPVRPAVAAPAAAAPIAAMPVLRPPSTGDAGLLIEQDE